MPYIAQVAEMNKRFQTEKGCAPKYIILTYGCQMNEHDSENLAGMLEEMGYEKAVSEKEADLILLNTCCIREKAESKVLSHLGELRKLKKDRPWLIIGVCGCMTQQKDIVETIRHAAPYVQLIFGTYNMHHLPEYLAQVRADDSNCYNIFAKEEAIVEDLPSKREYPFKALVNIIYGCNNFCTYCIVPYVRGRERSRSIENIVKEIEYLVQDGVQEITLLGQNVNSYGKDLHDGTTFAKLIAEIENIDGLKRVRYMTSHPKDFTDELIEVLKNSNKVPHYLHLPVQSGSSRILKRMNRGYSKEDYLELIRKVKEAMPDIAITTDIIVGFPGETEEDFQETLDLVSQVEFDNAFSFVYSKRPGTPAATMEDNISAEEKKERLARLNALLAGYSYKKNQNYLGRTEEVLVEGLSKNNAETLMGRTQSNKTVIFAGDESLIGKFVPVKITEAQSWILKGEIAL